MSLGAPHSWLAHDLAHGVVEAHFEDVDEEVDGVAFEVALGPAPVAFFDDETGEGGQLEVARLRCDELQAALFQQGNQRALPGLAGQRGFVRGSSGEMG